MREKVTPKLAFIINFALIGVLPAFGVVLLRLMMTELGFFEAVFAESTIGPALLFLVIGFILALRQARKNS